MDFPKLNRLCKWRTVFTGWQLGTRVKGDPESDAVRDTQERLLILRAELTAMIGLLIRKGVATREEIVAAIEEEAEALSLALELQFPGFKATDIGMDMHLPAAAETMRGWRP